LEHCWRIEQALERLPPSRPMLQSRIWSSQPLSSNSGELDVLEILGLIRLRCRGDKSSLQGLLQPKGVMSRWRIGAGWQVIPYHNERLGMLPMDLVPKTRESFLGRRTRTQANGGSIMVSIRIIEIVRRSSRCRVFVVQWQKAEPADR